MKSHSSAPVILASTLSIIFIALSLVVVNRASATAPAIDQPQRAVCFVSAGQSACVERPALSAASTITAEVRALTQWLIAGPTTSERAAGVQSALPSGAQLGQVHATDQQATIGLILPDDFLRTLTADQVEDINEAVSLHFYSLQLPAFGN